MIPWHASLPSCLSVIEQTFSVIGFVWILQLVVPTCPHIFPGLLLSRKHVCIASMIDPLICATIHVTAVWSPYRKGRKIWSLRHILILYNFIFQIHSKHLNTIVCASFASDITVLISSVLFLQLLCYVYVYLPSKSRRSHVSHLDKSVSRHISSRHCFVSTTFPWRFTVCC